MKIPAWLCPGVSAVNQERDTDTTLSRIQSHGPGNADPDQACPYKEEQQIYREVPPTSQIKNEGVPGSISYAYV